MAAFFVFLRYLLLYDNNNSNNNITDMAIYLKKFENHTQYETYINGSGAILPNVSLCVQEGDVHYNPSSPTPPTPSHDYVEIGGIKWATMNVGATSITDTGLYFQWGDTQGYTAAQVGEGEGQKLFGCTDYKWTTDYCSTFTKYNFEDELIVLQPSDDAVVAAWGDGWRIPTTAEFQALGNAVNTAWTENYNSSGVAGLICTDKTDSSKVLFFPACGHVDNGEMYDVGDEGYYLSSIRENSEETYNQFMYLNSTYIRPSDYQNRYLGYSIRGVLDA